jgi:hypothetical protein
VSAPSSCHNIPVMVFHTVFFLTSWCLRSSPMEQTAIHHPNYLRYRLPRQHPERSQHQGVKFIVVTFFSSDPDYAIDAGKRQQNVDMKTKVFHLTILKKEKYFLWLLPVLAKYKHLLGRTHIDHRLYSRHKRDFPTSPA